MTAYRRVYNSRHLQADCQEPESAPEPYAQQSSMRYLYLFRALMKTSAATKPRVWKQPTVHTEAVPLSDNILHSQSE